MASVLELPEGLLQGNEPLLLYILADGTEVKAALLPSDSAKAWAEKARALDDLDFELSLIAERIRKCLNLLNKASTKPKAAQLEAEVLTIRKDIREVQAKKFDGLQALLGEYNEKVFCDAVLAESTIVQLVGAFERLKLYNDPFVVSAALEQEGIKAAFEGMRSQAIAETN